jgi:hypothetical protein
LTKPKKNVNYISIFTIVAEYVDVLLSAASALMGAAIPSQADELIDIRVLDHVVIFYGATSA